MESLQGSKNDHGSDKFRLRILVVVDYLSKWASFKAISSAPSSELVDFLIKRVVLEHGLPFLKTSDQGNSLTSSFSE